MQVTLEVNRFLTMKAEQNASYLHEEPPTDEELENEYQKLYQEFQEATIYCMECFGTDHAHYLGCSIWSRGYRKD